ncbi:uncharacterized protein [Clytia hemisphaerica]|uniref:WD40 domain containing protein n=1 Tax=Clytia hemisphaerica TaxID=252671 RepID=A0A7M5X9C6_9CNID
MGEIVAAKLTIGLVWKLFAPAAAQKLQYGDVSEEKIRQMLLSEFSKIHESLNALRRKELVAAIAFMETGFELLGRDLKTAREEFRKARDAGQMAFGVVPETTDKILATKVMVTSTFYEFQDNVETARTLCTKYLDRMNTMPEVVRACEMIYTPQKSVAGRLLSIHGKEKRNDILQNAAEVNISVWNYMRDLLQTDFEVKPSIRFGKFRINPISDLVLMRKPTVIAEIDKCQSNFISVTTAPGYIFAAIGESGELQQTNVILALNLQTCHVTNLLVHEKTVMTVEYDGQNLCSGSADKSIVIWDMDSLAPVKIIQQHEGSVRTLCHTDDYLISGSADSTICVWKKNESYELQTVMDAGAPVMVVQASRRKFLFSISGISTVRIWDLSKFTTLQEVNISTFGQATVPNIQCPEIIANDNMMIIPVKSEDGEHIQCWNLGCLSLSESIPNTGHNIAKFYNNPYVFCGSDKVKMVTSSGRVITEQDIYIGQTRVKRILKMWIEKCYLYMMCQTERDSFFIIRY